MSVDKAEAGAALRRELTRRLGRAPSELEQAMAEVMWSEHCSYAHSKKTLGKLPRGGSRLLVGPGENAGILDIGDGWAVAAKIESHNHPSAVEPFEGAATGIGGILRDVLATGARPVAFLDSIWTGPVDVRRSRYLLRGMVSGIGHYGNAVGVPTVAGETGFDPCFAANPLVNAMCVGLVRCGDIQHALARRPGDRLVLVGAGTGRDGIAGASFASENFTGDEALRRPQVQVGDPFFGKLLVECVLELVAEGLLEGLGDLGAAGLTSAISEMASRGGAGAWIELDAVFLREPGMGAGEIMLSETQERMLAVVAPSHVPQVLSVAGRWGIGAADIGEVTAGGLLEIYMAGRCEASLPASVLAEGPQVPLRPQAQPRPSAPDRGAFSQGASADGLLLGLLEGPEGSDRSPLFERFDRQVGLLTLTPTGSDAAVLRLPEGKKGLALCVDARPDYVAADARLGAMHTVLEGLRNVAAVGGRPIGVTDCLNFGDPERGRVADDFEQAVAGIALVLERARVPVLGGNVSFYNESGGVAIKPTPVVGTVGLLEDVGAVMTGPVRPGSSLYLVGQLARWLPTGRAASLLKVAGGGPPPVDLTAELATLDAVLSLWEQGLVSVAHDVSGGGALFALAELCLWSAMGLSADLSPLGAGDPLGTFFGEGGGGFLAVARPGCEDRLEAVLAKAPVPFQRLGRMGGGELALAGPQAFSVPLCALRQAYHGRLGEVLDHV